MVVRGRSKNAPTGLIVALIFVCRRGLSPHALPNAMSPKAFPSGEGGRHEAKRSWLTDEERIDIKLTFSPHPPQAVPLTFATQTQQSLATRVPAGEGFFKLSSCNLVLLSLLVGATSGRPRAFKERPYGFDCCLNTRL